MPPLPPLPPLTLLVVEVGSTAHGTGRPGHEDHDEIAVYAEHPSEVLGLADSEPRSRMLRTAEEGEVSTPEDSDRVLHPLRRFVRLCARGNPSLVMAFWAPVIQTTPFGDELRELGPAFVGRHLVDRYRGYMRDQAQKVLGVRAVPGQSHHDPTVGYQTKAAMHASRLGFQGYELLTTGALNLPIQGEPREWLLAVRNGSVPFEEWWERTLELDERLGALADDDSIPLGPDLGRVEPWLAATYRELWLGLADWTPPPPPPAPVDDPPLPPAPPAPQPPPAPAVPEPAFPEPAVVGRPVPPLPPVETWFVEDRYEAPADGDDPVLATDLTALEPWVPRLRANLAAPWSVATRLRVEGSARLHDGALIDEMPMQLTALRLPEDSLNPAEGVPLLSRLRMLYQRLLPPGIRYPIAADWYEADGRVAVLDRFSRLPAGRLNGFLLSSEVTDILGVVVAGSAPGGRDPALLNVGVPLASAAACRDDDFFWATPPNWYRVEELVMTTPNLQATAKLEPLTPGTDADAWTQIVFSRAPFLRDMKVLADRPVPIAGVTDARMQRFDWQPSGGLGRQLTTVATGLVDGAFGFSFVFEVPLDTTLDHVFLADPDEVLASVSVLAPAR